MNIKKKYNISNKRIDSLKDKYSHIIKSINKIDSTLQKTKKNNSEIKFIQIIPPKK
jgi:hypothetical protein